MLNEWTRVSHPELLDMDDNQVDQALFTYFDIKA
jgi:hypothetical protein